MRSALLHTALIPLLSLGLAAVSAAQSPIEEHESAVVIDRGSVDLLADLEDATHLDADVADTALVFTNIGANRTGVWCRAYDSDGNIVGRADTFVPGNGLRYLRASDLSGGTDFVGSAVCKARGRVEASVVFLAPSAITSLRVEQQMRRGVTKIRFPVIASY